MSKKEEIKLTEQELVKIEAQRQLEEKILKVGEDISNILQESGLRLIVDGNSPIAQPAIRLAVAN